MHVIASAELTLQCRWVPSAIAQTAVKAQAQAAVFDSSRLVDFMETIQYNAPVTALTPLVSEPGRLVINHTICTAPTSFPANCQIWKLLQVGLLSVEFSSIERCRQEKLSTLYWMFCSYAHLASKDELLSQIGLHDHLGCVCVI